MDVTGRLEDWKLDPTYSILWGDCYDDVHARWEEGQRIHTSHIAGLRDMDLKEGDIVNTLNSRYILGSPLEDIDESKCLGETCPTHLAAKTLEYKLVDLQNQLDIADMSIAALNEYTEVLEGRLKLVT